MFNKNKKAAPHAMLESTNVLYKQNFSCIEICLSLPTPKQNDYC